VAEKMLSAADASVFATRRRPTARRVISVIGETLPPICASHRVSQEESKQFSKQVYTLSEQHVSVSWSTPAEGVAVTTGTGNPRFSTGAKH
jgi:hypothetical protein